MNEEELHTLKEVVRAATKKAVAATVDPNKWPKLVEEYVAEYFRESQKND